jgi:hypothetical protein
MKNHFGQAEIGRSNLMAVRAAAVAEAFLAGRVFPAAPAALDVLGQVVI